MSQQSLTFSMPGQAAADTYLTARDRERMKQQCIREIYIAHFPDTGLMTWAGRSQKPAWVTEWLAGGGTLQQLHATL